MDADSFIYHQNAKNRVFPIDFSLQKFDPNRGGNTTYVRNMVTHPFIKEILLDLVWATTVSKEDQERLGFDGIYPLPVEAETFLRCFYELIEKDKYSTTETKKEKLEDNDLKRDFSTDLCLDIAESIFSEEGKQFDDAAYCRHVLSQDHAFRHTVMSDLWESELTDRVLQIKELVEKIPPEFQFNALQNVLLSLDNVCLDLIRLGQVNKGKEFSNEPPDPGVLLKQLLSNRNKVITKEGQGTADNKKTDSGNKIPQKKLAIYKIRKAAPEGPTDGNANLELDSAFLELEGQNEVVNSPLMKQARLAYLANLEKMVEPSPFEAQYLEIQHYIDMVSKAPNATKLKQRFTTVIKERCCYEIDNMMRVFRKQESLQPNIRYSDVLIYNMAWYRAEKGIQCFDDILELIRSFSSISKDGTKLKNLFVSLRSPENGDVSCSLEVPLIFRIPRKKYFIMLQKLFGEFWVFMGYNWPINASGQFTDLKWIAKKFVRGAKDAAEFFNKGEELLLSESEVYTLLKICENCVIANDSHMSGCEIADISFAILAMMMLQTLQRITMDGVDALLPDFQILQEARITLKKRRMAQREQEKCVEKPQIKGKQRGQKNRDKSSPSGK